MTTLILAKNILEKNVHVVYPDGKHTHDLSVSDVIDRFKNESPEWLDNFINRLINTGESITNFGAKYTLK
jgi:hypothetical protein